MTSREQAPQDHAYILRFWETRSVPPDPPTTWRFSLENLRNEEAHKFPDVESLTAFLQRRVGEDGSNHRGPGNGRPSREETGDEEGVALGTIEGTVLLLEEDEAIRRSMGLWLEVALPGCCISLAGGDEEALALVEAAPPEMIVVDVAPPREDGLEAVRRLRAAAPAAAIVALTMDEDAGRREAALSAGASADLAIWRVRETLVPTLRGLSAKREERIEGKTVVCIEDELEIINLVQLALARHGVDLVGVMGGREGLDTIRQVRPDLVLLDLMMPDVDGWQVYQRMKADERLRDIPVIVMTVLDPYWIAKQGLDLSTVDGYVAKPFMPQELADRVHETLRVVA
jgi:CheY-like chemotaxis protein